MKKELDPKILAITLVGAAVLIFTVGYLKREGTSQQPADYSGATHIDRPINRTLTLNSDDWSPEINLGISQPLGIVVSAVTDDTPYHVMINGGKDEGGVEYDVPARRDWKHLKWTAPQFPNSLVRVKVGLTTPGLRRKQLVYTIVPL